MLWFLEEHTALETVRQYLPHTHGQYENVHIQYIHDYSTNHCLALHLLTIT